MVAVISHRDRRFNKLSEHPTRQNKLGLIAVLFAFLVVSTNVPSLVMELAYIQYHDPLYYTIMRVLEFITILFSSLATIAFLFSTIERFLRLSTKTGLNNESKSNKLKATTTVIMLLPVFPFLIDRISRDVWTDTLVDIR